MLKKTIQYSLLSLTMMSLSACTAGRTITIGPETTSPVQRPVVAAAPRPEIREEVLLGRGTANASVHTPTTSSNSTLGNRVDVPTNNPTLGDMVVDEPIVRATNEVMERIPFPVEEYKQVKKKGRSTVSGNIYLENSHSSLKIKGEKIKLWLNPVTSYSRQWYEESYLGGYKLSKTDKRLYNYLKFTYSDTSGKFNFFGVPAGDYYLTGSITCGEECGYYDSKSIRLVREISVGKGVTTVDLMKNVP